MDWIKATVATTAFAVDDVSNILFETGAEGIQVDDSTTDATISGTDALVTGFFPETTPLAEKAPEIEQRVHTLVDFGVDVGAGIVTLGTIDDDSWATAWEKYYHAVRLTRYLTIVPRWEDYTPQQAGELQLILDPGRAFGTGTHPTTRLTLGLLEGVLRGGEAIIDVGTGSGVLAIAAMQLGAHDVLATDVDDAAVASARVNIELNPGAAQIEVIANDLLNGITKQADLVLANMLPVVLLPLIPQVRSVLKPSGQLLLSGIIVEKRASIVAALLENDFVVHESREEDGWVGLRASLKGDEA